VRTYLDCYPCMLGQAVDAARMTGASEELQRSALREVLEILKDMPSLSKPPEIGHKVHRIVRARTGDPDPYREAKAQSTHEALELLPWMRHIVDGVPDPLEAAARLSIAGNIIDAIPGRQYNLRDEVRRVLDQPLAVGDVEALRDSLREADWVLYLADNAGETVCDRPLIEAMALPVKYAVKGAPVANDATMDDALAAGVDQSAEVVSTGSDAPGTLLETCSPAFQRLYADAPLIIAKGQANYECLSEAGPRVFFLLQAKCPVLARDLNVLAGSTVLRQGGGLEERPLHGEEL